MVPVRKVDEFVKENEDQIKHFMSYKTGIIDEDIINDQVQDFYIKLIETRALDTYDSKKGSFNTYISNLFCWMLPGMARKNFRVKYKVISRVSKRGSLLLLANEDAYDVWDFVDTSKAKYRVSPQYDAFHVKMEEEEETERHLEEFKDYIRKTESDKNARRMITYLEQRYAGCNAVNVALTLGLSANMVKIIKQNLWDKYNQWNQDLEEAA